MPGRPIGAGVGRVVCPTHPGPQAHLAFGEIARHGGSPSAGEPKMGGCRFEPMWSRDEEAPLCRAPFTAMEFSPDGSVLVCCANFLHPIGWVGEQGLREMWTGPAANRLRDAIERQDLSLGCSICRHRIRHHGAELPLLAYEHLDVTEGGDWPPSLSFSLHNTCNLECVMCGADRSS